VSEFSLNRNAITTALAGYVPYVGATANLNLGLFKLVDNANVNSISPDLRTLYNTSGDKTLSWETGDLLGTPTQSALNWLNRVAFDSSGNDGINWELRKAYDDFEVESLDWKSRILYGTDGTTVQVDWSKTTYTNGVYLNTLQVDNIFPAANSSVSFGSAGDVDVYLKDIYFSSSGGKFYDSSNYKSFEATTSQRQLFDFGGSYPSVDFGQYWLSNIGISNSTPLLDWSVGSGGSVKINNGSTGYTVGDFTNHALNDGASGNTTLNWGTRQCFDNTSTLSVDWDYHLLTYSGNTTVDWQNKYLMHNGGGGNVNSIEWGNFKCMNSGGFTSVDYGNHQLYDLAGAGTTLSGDYSDRKLYATDGTTVVLNWQTQQTSSGAQTATGTWGATEQTMLQEAYDALRVYGLLS
jgi:hypothetical protein